METISKTDCEKIGFLKKTHGIHGEVVLEFESHFEYSVEEAERFLIELEGLLVPFFVKEDGFRFKTANTAIIIFSEVESEKYAKRLIGNSVFLFKNEIVDAPNQSLDSQFINHLLIDETLGDLGIINQVDDFSGNIVLTINFRGKEVLIPYNDDFLISVNEEQKTILLKLPEGLFDLE